jgi:hypothetical protein
MPAHRGAFLAAFEAHHILALDRSADCDGGSTLLDFGRAADLSECAVNHRDQRSHLIGGQLVVPEIRRDNRGCVVFQADFILVRHRIDLLVSLDRLHRSPPVINILAVRTFGPIKKTGGLSQNRLDRFLHP